ncbi:DUF4135 domain-containing protein [Streptococcus sobrinus]|uniref:DUF4135 domain-containing protein n=2 Tax=Streptococcus sobrinus TaxID=1310 RepID=UPI0002EE2BF3|nr:DUF4135 domain-containing protein [Streptococcus sobrinus]
MLEDIKPLEKISGREDIELLLKKYAYRTEISFIYESNSNQSTYDMWLAFHNSKLKNEKSLYFSMIKFPFERIVKALKESTESNIFNVENISRVISEYMLSTVYSLSESLFNTEIRIFDETAEKYLYFLSQNYEEYKRLVNKYPYWNYLMTMYLDDTEKFFIEFITNISRDQEILSEKFFNSKKLKIENLKLSMGDRHKGRFVVEVKTDLGNVFYKPRGAKIDSAFEKCLNKLSKAKNVLDMESPTFIDRKTYSWFEKIEYTPLESDKGNYYRRLGQLLAIIYILNGNDIHHENLISHGEYPVIIDIETVLTNRLVNKKASASSYLQKDSNGYAFDSVQSSLILPNEITIRNKQFDFSPIKFSKEGVVEIEKSTSHSASTSELGVISDKVCEGFKAIYKEVSYNKSAYIKFFNDVFVGKRIRFLNKPTNVYGSVMDLLTNPVCLYNPNYAFSLTTKLYGLDSSQVKEEELFEQEELLRFNIPYFEVKTNSRDLILSEKRKINNYFIETPIESLETKINILGDLDLNKQLAIIKGTFLTASDDFEVKELSDINEDSNFNLGNRDKGIQTQDIEKFINETIKSVFTQRLINPFSNHYFWIGPMSKEDDGIASYQVMDFPNRIYMGNIGILHVLLTISNSNNYGEYIDKLIKDIEEDVEVILQCQKGDLEVSAYNGIASFLRYYNDLYKFGRIDSEEFYSRVTMLIEQIDQNIDSDKSLDILDGTAGAALSIIASNEIFDNQRLRTLSISVLGKCYKHLINSVVTDGDKIYFPQKENRREYMTGFSHGSSGILMALYKVGKFIGIDSSDFIYKVLQTERELYNSKDRVWYRGNKSQESSWAWCHGVPGILLSRVDLYLDGYRDEKIEDELRELYEITIEKSLGFNLTYCHGDFGNILICKYVQSILNFDDSRISKYLDNLLPYLMKSRTLKLKGTESVGLMVGLMGVVEFLDNIYLQNKIDSIELLKITPIRNS